MLFNIQKNDMVKIYPTIVIFLLLFLSPALVNAATLSVNPASGSFEVGDNILIKIIAKSDKPFNAVSGVLSLSSSFFSINSVSKNNSILSFWVTDPKISRSENTVKFEGIALGGFAGSTGEVLSVNLKALKAGSGIITFQSGQILANDGQGTDITGALSGANFVISEAIVKPVLPKPEPSPTPEPLPVPSPEVPELSPILQEPEIVLGARYGEPAIIGTSEYPESQVLVTFIALDGTKIFILGSTDINGSFNLLIPNSLKHGNYKVNAVVIRKDLISSRTSNTIEVEVGNFLSDVGLEIKWLISLLILAVIYLIIRNYLLLSKNRGKNINREVAEAGNVVHRSFDILREDIIDYDNKKLSSAEHKRMSDVKKDIVDAEKVIDKKIKDIGL